MDPSFLKVGVILVNFIPSSNVEFVIPNFIVLSRKLLYTSILFFKRKDDILLDGHDTLVLRFN